MQTTCSCRTRLQVPSTSLDGELGSNMKARSTLYSWWALVLTPTWMQMLPRAAHPGHRRFRRPRSPASRNEMGHLPFASRERCKRAEIVLDAHCSCEQARPVGSGERVTCDALIQVPAARAARGSPRRGTVQWLGRMFWAGSHARHISPELRGPGSGPGAPPLAGALPRAIEIRPGPGLWKHSRVSWLGT
jgi:hypothetical protein